MKFYTPLDLTQNELQNPILQNLPAAPANPKLGQLFFNSALKAIQVWNGTTWITLGAGTTGGFNPKGNWDASTNTPALADGVGANGDIYRVNVAGSTTLNNFNKWDVGDELFYDGANWVPIDNTIYATVESLGAKTGKFSLDVGDGAATAIVVAHNLGTRDVAVTLRRNVAPYDVVYADIELTTANSATLRFSMAPSAAQYRVVVVG